MNDLIARLSGEAVKKPLLRVPVLLLLVFGMLGLYGVGAQFYLGLRPDLSAQLASPLFLAEIISLALITLSGALATIHALYPDQLQRRWVTSVPLILFGMLAAVLAISGIRDNPTMNMDFLFHENGAGMKCTLCIASISILPSAMLFALLRKGATTKPLNAGMIAAFTAAAIGCFALRLAEPSDSSAHFILWHYLPTLAFSGIGALLGKFLLRW